MASYVVSHTNQANTQDWINVTKDLRISPYIEGYSVGTNVEIILYPIYERTSPYSPQRSSFDWEEGARTLLEQYDEAWRRLASL